MCLLTFFRNSNMLLQIKCVVSTEQSTKIKYLRESNISDTWNFIKKLIQNRVPITLEQKGFVENNVKFPKIPLLLTISIPKWGFEIHKGLQKPKLRHICGCLARNWGDRMPRCKYVMFRSQSRCSVQSRIIGSDRALSQKRRRVF